MGRKINERVTLFVYSFYLLTDQGSGRLQVLNEKINHIKRQFENDIEDIKYDILDLKLELELERRKIEDIANNSFSGITDGIRGRDDFDVLTSKIESQNQLVMKLSNDMNVLKNENAILRKAVEDFGDSSQKFEITANNCREEIITIKANMDDLTATLLKAFRNEKLERSKIQTAMLERVDIDEAMIKGLKVGIQHKNTSVDEAQTKVIAANEEKIRELELTLSRLNGRLSNELSLCCSKETLSGTKALATATPPVTVISGRYKIFPIYGSDILKHIKAGSRVVRGQDWSWGNQDGGGPGSVSGWMGNNPQTLQVMVVWDHGELETANYRVGAHGKYDLYLLADQ